MRYVPRFVQPGAIRPPRRFNDGPRCSPEVVALHISTNPRHGRLRACFHFDARSTFRSCSLMVAGADLQLAIPGTCAPDGLHTNRSTFSRTAPLKTRLYFGCLEHMDGGELHPSASACAVTIKSAHYIITPPPGATWDTASESISAPRWPAVASEQI